MPSNRALKVADRIKEVIAITLETKVKDPRLGFITITDVRVTGDLQQASVFYTVLGDGEAQSATAAALTSSRGLVRREVGNALGLRITPTIEFFADGLQEAATAMNERMSSVRAADAALAKLRAQAKPIGEPDPYKSHE
jgi:ribosome-binding factor A